MSNIQIEVGKKYRDRLGNFYLIDREEKKFKGKSGWPVWSGKKAWWNNGSSYGNQVNDTDLIEEVKENEMTIEVGKYYKTRSGHKAFVAFEYNSVNGFTHGGVVYGEQNAFDVGCSWYELGNHIKREMNNDFDLIEEWKEPKSGIGYLHVYIDDGEIEYRFRDNNNNLENLANAIVRVEWNEGQFDE